MKYTGNIRCRQGGSIKGEVEGLIRSVKFGSQRQPARFYRPADLEKVLNELVASRAQRQLGHHPIQ